jgi:hypothetical protein
VTIDVLANDSDPDGDTHTVSAAANGSRGTVQVVNGGTAIRYSPSANANGADAFTYTLSDAHGATATGTVNLTVTPVADPPAATNDAANTSPGTPVAINVLANDSDPDGDALTVSAVTQPANGSAAITGGGQNVTYTPPAGFTGSASFAYTASDGNGGTSTATVTVTVTSPPPPPPPGTGSDLQIRVTKSPASPRAGEIITYAVTIRNRGPAATLASLNIRSIWLEPIAPSECQPLRLGYRCLLGTMPSGSELQMTFLARRDQRGIGVTQFDVYTQPDVRSDPNGRNNSVIVNTFWR